MPKASSGLAGRAVCLRGQLHGGVNLCKYDDGVEALAFFSPHFSSLRDARAIAKELRALLGISTPRGTVADVLQQHVLSAKREGATSLHIIDRDIWPCAVNESLPVEA